MSDERLARVALSRLVEPGNPAVWEAVAERGPVATWEAVRTGAPLPGLSAAMSQGAAARAGGHDPARDLEALERLGGRLVCPGDPEWPEHRLTWSGCVYAPPLALFVRGPRSLAETVERSVAVVGSRTATAYGEQVAADLAAGLVTRGWTVVSGAAFGIDGSAHRGALAVDGPTIAVLAGGVERPYPVAHSALIKRIAEQGLVVSEVAPGCAPMKSRFLSRNRLIAGMTRGTVVVEADLRSGSRNTVKHALVAGRPVGAVPVTSMTSAGCHQEIREGRASLVTSADEVIDLVGDLGADACEPLHGPVLPEDGLSLLDAAVLEAVPFRAGADLDRLVVATAQPPLGIRAALGRLERAGLVTEAEGRWRKRPIRSTAG